MKSKKPKVKSGELNAATREAARRAEEERIRLANQTREEEDAKARGLRGRRALLSSAGGELGFTSKLGY
jgi:hypothetical protein